MEQQSNNVLESQQNDKINGNLDDINNENYKLNFNVEEIVNNLFNGVKPTNLSFNQFLELIDNESDNSICWRIENLPSGRQLYLFSNEWNIPNNIEVQKFSSKYFNNLVIDNQFNVLMYGGPKIFDSNRDKYNLEKIKNFYGIENNEFEKIYEAYEGTSINVFFEQETNKWFYCTKKKFRMFDSFFGSTNSHGMMFEQIISCVELETKLNKNYSYNFILIHNLNSHIIKDNVDNKLVLVSVRNTLDGHKQVDIHSDEIINSVVTLNKIVLPKEVNLVDFTAWNQENSIISQGIILHHKSNIFRVYTNAYGKQLKSNPKFHTDQEKLLWAFQTNKLTEYTNEETYNLTLSAINYVAIMLFRTLLYFTKFKKDFTDDEKFSYTNYNFITKNNEKYEKLQFHNALKRNIYKLQRLPFAIKNIDGVDFNQVKHHIKYHCSPQDIYGMYQTFSKNSDFETMVNYKCLPNQRKSINNFVNIKLNE